MRVLKTPQGSGGFGFLRGLWGFQGVLDLPENKNKPPGSPTHTPLSPFPRRLTDASGKESWVTNNTYWKLRLDPGFAHLDSAVLW